MPKSDKGSEKKVLGECEVRKLAEYFRHTELARTSYLTSDPGVLTEVRRLKQELEEQSREATNPLGENPLS